jgi:hypothetical protein
MSFEDDFSMEAEIEDAAATLQLVVSERHPTQLLLVDPTVEPVRIVPLPDDFDDMNEREFEAKRRASDISSGRNQQKVQAKKSTDISFVKKQKKVNPSQSVIDPWQVVGHNKITQQDDE